MNQLSFLPSETEPDHRRPAEPIVRTACVEGRYRRWLVRKWGAGPLVGWAMHNPSDADGKRDDPTLWRIMGFSFRWGYGGLVVANHYPVITSSPRECHRWRASFKGPGSIDTEAHQAFIRNHADCAALFSDCALLMAAWGAGADPGDVEQWLEEVTAKMDRPALWHCLGTTADGSPKHPLARGKHRVPDDQRPMLWRRS